MDTYIFVHVINIFYLVSGMSSASLVGSEDFLLDSIPTDEWGFPPHREKTLTLTTTKRKLESLVRFDNLQFYN